MHGHERLDAVAIEEPLEIRIDGRPLSVTMRTPGHDADLALGFLLTEAIIRERADVLALTVQGARSNTIDCELRPAAREAMPPLTRHFYAASSCGVCGKASVEAVRTVGAIDIDDEIEVSASLLLTLPERLRSAQPVFEQTGGLHAAALFDAHGALVCLREDVGRHNAVDKVIGARLDDGALPARGQILLVSGRASFEIVQKAAMARIAVLAAVGAPSSLAIELADEVGMTLVGFLRDRRFNVYAGVDRIAPDRASPGADT
jgi:FdhD protein